MTDPTYRFTRAQLHQALTGAIEMYVEFREQHGQDDATARLAGAGEVLEGLDADKYLAADDPTERLKLQLHDVHLELLDAADALLDVIGHVGGIAAERQALIVALIKAKGGAADRQG